MPAPHPSFPPAPASPRPRAPAATNPAGRPHPALPRWRDRLRPWLIALTWLLCASLFKVALGMSPAPDDPAASEPQGLTLVIPFSPGSGPDRVARTMAEVWTERFGEPVAVRNLPDREGYAAARQVATAAPDGRVLLLTSSPLLDRPARLPDEPFRPPVVSASDFTPLARVGHHPFVVVFPRGMFGRWLTPLSEPEAAPEAIRALSAAASVRSGLTSPSAQALEAVPDHQDFNDLSRVVPTWNALLAPPRLPAPLAARLRADWQAVVSDARVRLALAQTGVELWERLPKDTR